MIGLETSFSSRAEALEGSLRPSKFLVRIAAARRVLSFLCIIPI